MNIVFDLGAVYFTDGLTIAKRLIVDQFKVEPLELEYVLNGPFSRNYRTGLEEGVIFWKKAQEYLQVNAIAREQIKWIFFNAYTPQQNTIDLMAELRQQGHKLGYLSNSPEDRAKFLENRYQFVENFDFGLFSFQAHAWKPEKALYEQLMQKNSLDPVQTIYIDHIESWLKPAEDLGMKTILYRSFPHLLDDLGKILSVNLENLIKREK